MAFTAPLFGMLSFQDYRGAGLGRKLVETVLSHPMNRVERVYLMTTHQQRFYKQIGFESIPAPRWCYTINR